MAQRSEALRNEIEQTRERIGETVDAIGYRTNVPLRTKQRFAEMKDRIMAKTHQALDSLTGRTSGAMGVVSNRGSDAMDAVAEGMTGVAETTTGIGSKVASAIPDRREISMRTQKITSSAERNPLGLAIGALALGALVGTMMPVSRKEREKLAPMADQVKDTVRETSQQALGKGRDLIEEATTSARESLHSMTEDGSVTEDGSMAGGGEAGGHLGGQRTQIDLNEPSKAAGRI